MIGRNFVEKGCTSEDRRVCSHLSIESNHSLNCHAFFFTSWSHAAVFSSLVRFEICGGTFFCARWICLILPAQNLRFDADILLLDGIASKHLPWYLERKRTETSFSFGSYIYKLCIHVGGSWRPSLWCDVVGLSTQATNSFNGEYWSDLTSIRCL